MSIEFEQEWVNRFDEDWDIDDIGTHSSNVAKNATAKTRKLRERRERIYKGLADRGFPVVANSDWQEDAICPQIDPEAFFPDKGVMNRQIRTICEKCPVRGNCLAAAILSKTREGIWGGLTDMERRNIRKEIDGKGQ